MGALPNDINDALSSMRVACRALDNMICGAYALGQKGLAEKLESIYGDIEAGMNDVKRVAAEHFDRTCRETGEHTATLLSLALETVRDGVALETAAGSDKK